MADNMKIDVNADAFIRRLLETNNVARATAEQALGDCMDELERIASEITPLDKGTLTRSSSKKVTSSSSVLKGEVEFSVREGGFNYALWIHEGIYNHGERTEARGGTVGWSGKRYYVGRKYLERPINGERQAFLDFIGDKIRHSIGR